MKKQLILILGTTGTGKGTQIALLKERHPEFQYALSVTSRPIRPGEEEGENYFFVSKEEFESYIREGMLLEYDQSHGKHYYGILKKPLEDAIEDGKVVIREISMRGFKELMDTPLAKHIYSIFLMPPSIEHVKKRILARAPMADEEVERRLASARNEIAASELCDKKILSEEGQIEKIYGQLEKSILQATGGE